MEWKTKYNNLVDNYNETLIAAQQMYQTLVSLNNAFNNRNEYKEVILRKHIDDVELNFKICIPLKNYEVLDWNKLAEFLRETYYDDEKPYPIIFYEYPNTSSFFKGYSAGIYYDEYSNKIRITIFGQTITNNFGNMIVEVEQGDI